MGCNRCTVKHFGVVVDVKRCVPDGGYVRVIKGSPGEGLPRLLHDFGALDGPYNQPMARHSGRTGAFAHFSRRQPRRKGRLVALLLPRLPFPFTLLASLIPTLGRP